MHQAFARRMLLYIAVAVAGVVSLMVSSTPALAVLKCADLTLTDSDIVYTPASPIQNQEADIAVTVHNQGSCAATGFVVQWKSSPFSPTGPSQNVAGLAAGSSTVLHFTYAFPTAGNFQTQVKLDTGNGVPETIESNNVAIKAITVQGGSYDLAITSITFNPDPAVSTVPMTATVHVVNNGNTAAPAFRVSWKPGPLFAPLQSQQINSLAAGASTDVVFNYTYPRDGSFDTTATVDPPTGPSSTFTKTLVVDPPLPDLIVDSVVVDPVSPVAGAPMQLHVTVKNVGHAAAGDFQVKWKPTPLTSALVLGVVGPLNVGASTVVDFDYTFPSGGTFTGKVTADSGFRVREVDETNNTADVTVMVDEDVVDLAITDFHYTPANPVQGQAITFSVTIENQGNTAANNFEVSVNPDAFQISTPSLSTLTSSVTTLAAGDSTTIDFPFQYPKVGNFRAVAEADSFHDIKEPNEANNKVIQDLVVSDGDVDLTITHFELNTDDCALAVGYGDACSPMLYFKGSAVTATIDVTNNGTYPSGSFAVQLLLDDTASFGPTATVPGVLPGDTVTVTIQTSYSKDSHPKDKPVVLYNAKATVDVNNTVAEPGGEGNNTATISNIDVLPRDTTVSLGLTAMHVYNDLDDGIAGAGEWQMYLLATSPGDSCHIVAGDILDHTADNFKCLYFEKSPDDCPCDVGGTGTMSVTLTENQLLIVALSGLEDDGILNGLFDFPGYVLKIWLPGDYQQAGTVRLNGQGGDDRCPDDGTDKHKGKCFWADLQITVTKAAPPPIRL